MNCNISNHGWLPDLPNHSDFAYAALSPLPYAYLFFTNLASDFWTICLVQ
jgi:hypothetical protein